MKVRIIPVGPFRVNCIILWAHRSSAWIVDPGGDADKILETLDENDLSVSRCILTHGHIDHIGALDALRDIHRIPVHMGASDAGWAFSDANRMPPYLHVPSSPSELLTDLDQGKIIKEEGLEAHVLATPGHTPGSICLYFPEQALLISGDTLFADSVGRTDLPGGDAVALTASLPRFLPLPDSVRVICGHGPNTTIGREKRCNPFLKSLRGSCQ